MNSVEQNELLAAQMAEDDEAESGDMMGLGLNRGVIDQINSKKAAHPNMFVSGFEADDDGVEKLHDPAEELLTAAEEGDLAKVKQMLAEAKAEGRLQELLDTRDQDLYTATHRSAYGNHADVLKVLLEAGADPMARSDSGWTPLHSAANWACPETLGVLLSTGQVDVNAFTQGRIMPIHLAINSSELDRARVYQTVQYLLAAPGTNASAKNGAGDTPYDLARRSCPILSRMIRQFLDKYKC